MANLTNTLPTKLRRLHRIGMITTTKSLCTVSIGSTFAKNKDLNQGADVLSTKHGIRSTGLGKYGCLLAYP